MAATFLPFAIIVTSGLAAFALAAGAFGVAREAGPGRHRREALACSAAAMTAAILMMAAASHPIFWRGL